MLGQKYSVRYHKGEGDQEEGQQAQGKKIKGTGEEGKFRDKMSQPQSLGLDVEILRRLSRDRLVRVLEDAPGSKDLIIDGDLMKMFDRIAGASVLR